VTLFSLRTTRSVAGPPYIPNHCQVRTLSKGARDDGASQMVRAVREVCVSLEDGVWGRRSRGWGADFRGPSGGLCEKLGVGLGARFGSGLSWNFCGVLGVGVCLGGFIGAVSLSGLVLRGGGLIHSSSHRSLLGRVRKST
jgi:hypothetical protein